MFLKDRWPAGKEVTKWAPGSNNSLLFATRLQHKVSPERALLK